MKTHLGQGNSYKGKHLIGGLIAVSEAESIVSVVGSIACCRAAGIVPEGGAIS